MPETVYANAAARLSLLEMIVVLVIIAGLLSLLVPAVQKTRESSRRMVCKNNLRQMAIAMTHFIENRDGITPPAAPGRVGGWSVLLLENLEKKALMNELGPGTPLDAPTLSPHARELPRILTCPSAAAIMSSVPGIPASHYVLIPLRGRDSYRLRDGFPGMDIPWLAGPELKDAQMRGQPGPHDGGYLIVQTDGSVRFEMPRD